MSKNEDSAKSKKLDADALFALMDNLSSEVTSSDSQVPQHKYGSRKNTARHEKLVKVGVDKEERRVANKMLQTYKVDSICVYVCVYDCECVHICKPVFLWCLFASLAHFC